MKNAELTTLKTDIELQETSNILSDVCYQEASLLKQKMIELKHKQVDYETASNIGRRIFRLKPQLINFGRPYSYESLSLITPLFGTSTEIDDHGVVTKGWKAELWDQMPSAMMWGGKRPPDHAFASFRDSGLFLDQMIIDSDGNQRFSGERFEPIYFSYGAKPAEQLVARGDDELAKLRVVLEYGLQFYGVKSPKIL